jgi:hypothetical protein
MDAHLPCRAGKVKMIGFVMSKHNGVVEIE